MPVRPVFWRRFYALRFTASRDDHPATFLANVSEDFFVRAIALADETVGRAVESWLSTPGT